MTAPLRRIASTFGLIVATMSSCPARAASVEESPAQWFHDGAQRAHQMGAGKVPARNLILFIGDGMSLTTVTAARILEGQQRGQKGEENQLAFEQFPYTALSKTYNTDSQTPDSAGTMSAMMTGVKTRKGVLSVGQQAHRGDCASGLKAPMLTLIELAEQAGLATGVVTTTRITHATPAATYAHSAERRWESDAEMPANAIAEGCLDLARQLVEFDQGDGIDVVLGGGRSTFLPSTRQDPEYPALKGARRDGRDLIADWQKQGPNRHFAWNRQQLDALGKKPSGQWLGLFEPDHLSFEYDRRRSGDDDPDLTEMTRQAIDRLAAHESGYVLIVEAGRIDHAHHAGNAFRALTDTLALSDAVRMARQRTREDDTLILVTADHSHTLNLLGYPVRGNPILGKVHGSAHEDASPNLALDARGLPFSTLIYANGPGYVGASDQQPAGPKVYPHQPQTFKPTAGRPDLSRIDTEAPDHLQEAMLPLDRETHAGEDVSLWASGPGAEAVHGSIEQNVIFHLLAQSQPRLRARLCQLDHCDAGVPVALPAQEQPAQER